MADLLITPPTAGGAPAPTVTMTVTHDTKAVDFAAITARNMDPVSAGVIGGRIVRTVPGSYTINWTASNGIPPNATRSVTVPVTVPVGYLRMVVIGASQEVDLFGAASTTTPVEPASTEMGFPVFQFGVGGKTITNGGGGRDQIAQALTLFPTIGETLFLIGSIAGNDITAGISGGLSDAEADVIAAEYGSMLDLFGAHLPHVHAMQVSFRSYTAHGFSGSQLFDNPDAGAANLNDRLTAMFQSRLSQYLYYANGDSMVDWYNLVRNNYVAWIRDGIHHTTSLLPDIRMAVTSRLRAAVQMTPPAAVVPAARPAISVLLATVSAPAGSVGTAYNADLGRLFNLWDAPYTVTGLPAWATLSRDAIGQFTITGTPDAAASLAIAITATGGGVSQTSDISATISAPVSNTLSIINFTGSTYAASFQLPRNNVFADTAGIVPVALTDILDINGASTGRALNLSFTGSPAIGPNAPGRSSNNNGITAGVPAYAGQLLASEVTSASLFVTAGVTAVMQITNLTAGAQYEIGFVGSRTVAEVRNTTLTIEGVTTTWNTSESAPLERKVTVAAGPDGIIDLIMSPDGATTFAYLGGISIRKI